MVTGVIANQKARIARARLPRAPVPQSGIGRGQTGEVGGPTPAIPGRSTLGLGIGGLADGIFSHQLFRWHHTLCDNGLVW
jgi:hypothetical protein